MSQNKLIRLAPFILVHLVAIIALFTCDFTAQNVFLALGLYALRMFGVTAGYHRYFSHRTYKTSRIFQFVLAVLAQTSSQKGALWWAAHHRIHHRHSDKPGDPHSPKLKGMYTAHLGWILDAATEATEWEQIKDLRSFPELVWLNRFWWTVPTLFAVSLFVLGGWNALGYGFFISTVFLWHGTFTINSFAHVIGKPRYLSRDESKNHWLLAIITLGEGWHNNHHAYPASANQGFFWYELDISYLVLFGLKKLGIVWDLKKAPVAKLEEIRLKNLSVLTQIAS